MFMFLNSPLNRLDLFGLISEDFDPRIKFEINVPIIKIPNLPIIDPLMCCKGYIGKHEVDYVISTRLFT